MARPEPYPLLSPIVDGQVQAINYRPRTDDEQTKETTKAVGNAKPCTIARHVAQRPAGVSLFDLAW